MSHKDTLGVTGGWIYELVERRSVVVRVVVNRPRERSKRIFQPDHSGGLT
jgi:hypothetical protein